MIDNIIASYLSKNKRLVVPEFGAFIRKDGGELVFVEFLKKDDQVLTSLIGKEYELNESEAREAIEDYILTVKRTVGQTGKYVIAHVGTVHTDANGLYALDYNPSARKEAAPVRHATIGEQFTEPEMEVINARGHMPTVGEDMAMEPRETIIFPVRNEPVDTIAELSADEKVSQTSKEIEFQYREVAPTPEPARKATINDLYTMPADSKEPSVKAHEHRPAGQTRVESQRPHPEQPRHGGQQHSESPQRHEPQSSGQQRPTQRRPVNYSSAPKKKFDLVMILAIAAAVIALGSIMWGVFVKRDTAEEIRPTQIENVEAQPPVTE